MGAVLRERSHAMALRRSYLRISLRTLLIAVSALCCWLALMVNGARRQARAVAEIKAQRSGRIFYDFQTQNTEARSWVPRWITKRTGLDLFHSVAFARMDHLVGAQPWELDDLNARGYWDGAKVVADVRRHLAALPHLRRLELCVWPEVSEACLTAVGELCNLETLDCKYATDAGITHLPSQRRLKRLGVFDGRLTDQSLRVFGNLRRLEVLQATNNHFTDDGLGHLAQLNHLICLDIDCGESRFTDAGLVHLEGLQKLERLYLQQTLVTPAGIEKLQRAIPSLNDVTWTSLSKPRPIPPGEDPFEIE